MEFIMYASAIFNLSCAMQASFNTYHDFQPSYCDMLSVNNVLPLLCVNNGLLCVPATSVASDPYGQCRREWGFPRLKPRRKRGGRRKIRTVLTSDRPQHTKDSRRHVCSANLVNITFDESKSDTMSFGFMNIQSVNKK